jgi:hypothetical protein
MTSAISITVTLAVEPGQAEAVDALRNRIRADAARVDGMSVTDTWADDRATLRLAFDAASQDAIDAYLSAEGPVFAGFDGIARVTDIQVSGDADPGTVAVLHKLTDAVQVV